MYPALCRWWTQQGESRGWADAREVKEIQACIPLSPRRPMAGQPSALSVRPHAARRRQHTAHIRPLSRPRAETVGQRGRRVWWGWSTGRWRHEKGGDGRCWDTSAWDWKHQGGAWTCWKLPFWAWHLQPHAQLPPNTAICNWKPITTSLLHVRPSQARRAWCRMHMPDQWSLMHPPCILWCRKGGPPPPIRSCSQVRCHSGQHADSRRSQLASRARSRALSVHICCCFLSRQILARWSSGPSLCVCSYLSSTVHWSCCIVTFMCGAVPERFNWASCPQGTCPTAPYKIQPLNQSCCELWGHVSHEVSPFHQTCFRNGGNRASVWWLHSSFCFAQYCNNMFTLTRWHRERVTSSWKHVKVHADRIFGNCFTKRRISKKLKWTESSLLFQPAANLK